LKERYLHIATAVGGPFESKVTYLRYICCWDPLKARCFKHYGCYWGPLWKRSEPTYTLHLLLWASLKA